MLYILSLIFMYSNSTQYVTLQIKLDEEKKKHIGLARQNGFCPTLLHNTFAKFAKAGKT